MNDPSEKPIRAERTLFQFRGLIRGVGFRMGVKPSDIDDFHMNVVLEVLQRFDENRGRLDTFISVVMRGALSHYHRCGRNRRRLKTLQDMAEAEASVRPTEMEDLKMSLREAIDCLPQELRQLARMKLAGMPESEIARSFGVSESTIGRWWSDAKWRLRVLLGND